MEKIYPVYPIYHIDVKWEEDVGENQSFPIPLKWTEGLPEGRMRNGTGWYVMLKTTVDPKSIEDRKLVEWWPEYSKKLKNPSPPTISVLYKYDESWCMGWFSHWTFDEGQSDQEVLESFSRYVDRIQEKNRKEGCFKYFDDGTPYWSEPHCLMGAEDRWRWRGSKNGTARISEDDEETPPPCRCPKCKERGIIRIDH